MSLDIHSTAGHTPFFITWTAVGEYAEDFEKKLCDWHSKKCDTALVVSEGGPGEVEHLHYHSLGVFRDGRANGIKRQCDTLYKKLNMEMGKNTVKVKSVPEIVGLFHYLTKDLKDDPPLMIKGWRMSWIKAQCLANLKKMPHKMLLQDQYTLTPKTAVNIIIQYAKRKGLVLVDRLSFRDCLKSMVRDHYRVNGIWGKITIICAEVLMECGNDSMFDAVFDHAFFGLE